MQEPSRIPSRPGSVSPTRCSARKGIDLCTPSRTSRVRDLSRIPHESVRQDVGCSAGASLNTIFDSPESFSPSATERLDVRDLLSAAAHRYRKNGLGGLCRHAAVFGFGSAVVGLLGGGYGNTLADRNDLGERFELEAPPEGLSVETCLDLLPLQDDDSLEFQPSTFAFRTPFVTDITDVTLVGPHATAVTSEGVVVGESLSEDQSRTRWMCNAAIAAAPSRMSRLLRGRSCDTVSRSVSVGAVLYHQTGNYYHWLLEQVLKLRQIEHYESQTGETVTLVVSLNALPYVYDCLDLLGYDDERYIVWDGDPIAIGRLVVPSMPEPTPASLSWLRSRLLSAVDTSGCEPKQRRRLYVSRQNTTRGRKVANIDAVRSVLDRYDIEMVNFEEHSIAEQVRLVHSAALLVGPHGAGLTNLLWGDRLAVVELFNEVVSGPFYLLAHLSGQEYTALSGREAGNGYRINRDIVVDTTRLETTLESCLAESSNANH